MSTLNKYIYLQLLKIFIIVLLVITTLAWLSQILRYVEFIIEKNRTINEFMSLTILLYPWLISVIAPSAFFITCLVLLDRMLNDSEVVILYSSGVSPLRKLKPFLAFAIAVTLLIYFINILITPWSMKEFRDKITILKTDIINNSMIEGRFISPEEGINIYIKNKKSDNTLSGIFISDTRDKKNDITYIAKSANIIKRDGEIAMIMNNGVIHKTEKYSLSKPIEAINFDRYVINLSDMYTENNDILYKPSEKPLKDLLFPDKDQNFGALYLNKLKLEAHMRLSNPLYIMVFMLIAFNGMAINLRIRSTRIKPIINTSIIAFSIKILSIYALSLATKNPSISIAIYLIPIVTILTILLNIIYHSKNGRIITLRDKI